MLAPGSGNVSLRTVSSSRPQLMHSQSQQSIAASDDYYSFSSPSSSARSRASGSRLTVARYATPNSHPPSRTPSPNISRTHLAPQPAGARSEHSLNVSSENRNFVTPPSQTIRAVEEEDPQSSPMSDTTSRQEPSDSYAGRPPTPGVDDSPYIHFAISQLTRDEEVAGPRRRSSLASNDSPLEPLLWDEGLGCFIRSPGQSATPPARQPQQSSDSIGRAPQNSVDPESFVAVEPPHDSLLYPPLDYVPVVLRSWALAAIIICCLLMIAGLSFCNVWSRRHDGLWDYTGLGGSHYFVMQFLPQILGMVITIWTFVIQAAVYRIMPFAIMASERPLGHVLQSLPILSRNFLVPDFSYFRHGEAIVGFSLFTMWLSNLITLPLLSCLFQAKWYLMDGEGTWRWASVSAVGWTLVAVYAFLTIGLLLLMFRFVRTWSGLMWDPVSLADLISIIQRSNILHDFEQSETLPDVGESLDPRILRLGYWKLSNRADIFYGIGEVDAPVRTPSLHRKEKNLQMQSHGLSRVSFDVEQHGLAEKEEYYQHLYSPAIRYRWIPWFLRDGFVVLWTVIICALFIAFVLVSFIHEAIKDGFPPRLPTLPSTGAFSSSNFCYSFVPAFIGNVLFLAWQPIDVYFRALQPFAALAAPTGARAEQSLLLSYTSCFPFQVTLVAILNKHYKVAWISFMSTVSAAIPILAGGMFIALYHPSDGTILISALMPAFYAIVAFCALYMVSFLCIWPRRCRRLPHDISTLADQMSFLYQSPLLADKILREPRSKADLVTRLVVAPPGDREHSMYGFGIYVPRALTMPTDHTVTAMFFNSYIYSPRDPLILRGFMDILPDVFCYTQPGSHLHVGTLAVSYFSVAAWTGNRSFLQSAHQLFVKAIAKTREALQGDITHNVDDILMSILLLSTYEEFCAIKENRYPMRTHLRGAIALVNSKRPEQRSSIISLILENAVQVQLIKSSKGLAYPTMQTPNQWPPSPAAPQSASSQLLMITSELVGLRQAWDRFNEDGANHVDDIHDILTRAYHLDANLEAWNYALPEHWKPLPAVVVPQSVREAGMYKNRCDCYTDLWMAGTWNFYRDSRIVVQNIILRCLRILPDGVLPEQIQATMDLIETLALDICATVPYILGSQTMSVHVSPQKIEYPEADGRRVTTPHYPTAALVGGWMVSSHLSNLELLCLSEEMNTWIRAQKERQPLLPRQSTSHITTTPPPTTKMLFSSLFSSTPSTPSNPDSQSQSQSQPSSEQQPPTPSNPSSIQRSPTEEFDPPLPKLWTPKTNLKLLLGGLAFFTFSIYSTRRAMNRKLLASIPPYYTSSVYHKPKVSGGAEAFEALHLATMNVLSFGMMSAGGLLYALDINGVEDMRRFVRKGMVEGDGALMRGEDKELEREVEGWVAKVLGEKFGKELQREREREERERSAAVAAAGEKKE
ncbi:hypothetical protein ASPBRDRAFT_118194 [Aspergillus brasiliensis CBS 101740]|uniref:Altered inheritance of mitochondria protein 11 n=1 Tax=Aspergillus brasiliensis (strain CBS 101740 / IMI 381727 / IBT 21946) TaxID=767769 RepID=A0A1L9UV27_ASPBC|nr:hypothetical protein ASPBRDRAFT_118194 [Aspergillus brasiliensis CBS 101740]